MFVAALFGIFMLHYLMLDYLMLHHSNVALNAFLKSNDCFNSVSVLLNTYKHHDTKAHFIFSTFVSISIHL